ncbi:MAG: hypothetical protein GEU68_07420 [Actinobacteria bacterium]|nr:hypothetical protein [Actinomycetota bacterium]
MGIVRVILQGKTNDFPALVELVKWGKAFVEENEPGALAYECFADEGSGSVAWHEMYKDEDSFLAHVQKHSENGILDDLMKIYEIERLTFLTKITDPRVEEVAGRFGTTKLYGIGGLAR